MATIGDDGAVVFDWTLWQAEYFALAQKGVTQAAATAAFAKAGTVREQHWPLARARR
jgi:hypothetical protein